jgi:uncharacterized protein (DUF1330 family)
MPAYLTGHIKIRDVQKWHEYLAQVDATITAYGGEILLRGLQAEVLANPSNFDEDFERLVVLRFNDMGSLDRWYSSNEYAQLKAIRAAAADVTVVTYNSDSHEVGNEIENEMNQGRISA